MFRRNAEAIQGAAHPCVESLFDLVELNLDLAAYTADFMGRFVELMVGGIELFVDALLATFLDAFTGFHQFLEVVGTFLADARIGADACQPDLACVPANFTQGALGVSRLLHIHFGHALYLMLMSGGEEPPMEVGLEHKVVRQIRIFTLSSR